MAALITEIMPNTAGHLVVALRSYRHQMARSGMGFPTELEELEVLFARLWQGPREATEGREGSTFASHDGTGNAENVTPETLLTRNQAAARLQVSVTTLKRREKAGHLPATRHGRVVRYRAADLDNLHLREGTQC
jgi:excisionase family DNA binding protein